MQKRHNHITIRKTNGLTIICFDHQTIYVKHKYGINRYDRWFIQGGKFYAKSWKPFRIILTDQRNLDIHYINRQAVKYGINITSTHKTPSFSGKTIREAPEWGRARNTR